MTSWDRRDEKQLRRLQDELVRSQVRAVVAGSAYWKQRFAAIGKTAASVDGVTALATVPAVGERDVSPTGDPAAMAALVLHGGERQFALHASGTELRRALRLRATRSAAYRRVVDSETKPTSYVFGGLGFRYPIASTRSDLDAVARAGARLWQVLGLTSDDALVSAVPVGANVEHNALQLAALAAGAPALFPGDAADAVVSAARLAPPTVLAVPAAAALPVIEAAADAGVLGRLTTLLLVGYPSEQEREAAVAAVADATSRDMAVLAVHAPSGARVLWGECRQSAGRGGLGGTTGLHTYPDLDVLQLVDAETGEQVTASSGELVLTQVGMRGSALLRWRTGDVVAGVESGACPACGRSVPRVTGTRRGALVVTTDSGRALDLRAVAGALTGRADVRDWRVVVGGRARDGRGQVVVHLLPTGDDADETVVAAAADIRAVAGMLPSQLVATDIDALAALAASAGPESALTPRVLVRG